MAVYFVRNGGSDAADGLSDANAWETLPKVNGFTFALGDTTKLADSSEWRESLIPPRSGSSGSPMIFTNYISAINGGGGTLPKINGSELLTGWTLDSGNVWQKTGVTWGFTSGMSVWFDDVKGTVEGVADKASISVAGDWFWDSATDILYVHSTSDPDTAFTDPGVEIHRRVCIDLEAGKQQSWLDFSNIRLEKGGRDGSRYCFEADTGCDNINLTGLEITGSGVQGLVCRACDNWTITDCDFSFCGQRVSATRSSSNNGVGAHFTDGCNGITVDGCTSTDNGEGFITTEDVGDNLGCNNLTVRNCTISNSVEEGVTLKYGNITLIEDNEFISAGQAVNLDINPTNVTVRRNIFRDALSSTDDQFKIAGVFASTADVYLNTFYNCEGYAAAFRQSNSGAVVNFDHNTIYDCSKNTVNNFGLSRALIDLESALNANTSINVRNNVGVCLATVSAVNGRCITTEVSNSILTEQGNFWHGHGSVSVIRVQLTATSNYTEAQINDGTYTASQALGQSTRAGTHGLISPVNQDFRLGYSFDDALGGGVTGVGIANDLQDDPFPDPPDMGALSSIGPRRHSIIMMGVGR